VLGVLIQLVGRLLHTQIELLAPQGNKFFIELCNAF
jgi:hypothetical protein